MKVISIEELINLKDSLPVGSENKDSYQITSYVLAFTRQSKNTYTNLRILVKYNYCNESDILPFYAKLKEEEKVKFCSRFNAPRAPFFKEISEMEFYKLGNEIGCGKITSEIVYGLIEYNINTIKK